MQSVTQKTSLEALDSRIPRVEALKRQLRRRPAGRAPALSTAPRKSAGRNPDPGIGHSRGGPSPARTHHTRVCTHAHTRSGNKLRRLLDAVSGDHATQTQRGACPGQALRPGPERDAAGRCPGDGAATRRPS